MTTVESHFARVVAVEKTDEIDMGNGERRIYTVRVRIEWGGLTELTGSAELTLPFHRRPDDPLPFTIGDPVTVTVAPREETP